MIGCWVFNFIILTAWRELWPVWQNTDNPGQMRWVLDTLAVPGWNSQLKYCWDSHTVNTLLRPIITWLIGAVEQENNYEKCYFSESNAFWEIFSKVYIKGSWLVKNVLHIWNSTNNRILFSFWGMGNATTHSALDNEMVNWFILISQYYKTRHFKSTI